MAWSDDRNGSGPGANNDVYATLVYADGGRATPGGGPLAGGGGFQTGPVIASDGTGYLVAWLDSRSPSLDYDVYGARVSGSGERLDVSNGGRLVSGPGVQGSPSLVWNGSGYLLAWSDQPSGSVFAAPVSQGGVLADAGIVSLGYGNSPRVVWTGSQHLLLWKSGWGTTFRLDAVRLAGDGNLPSDGGHRAIGRIIALAGPPVAAAASYSTTKNTPLAMTLTCTDPDGDALVYAVATTPSHGALSGVAPALSYQPALDYVGADSFTFTCSDSTRSVAASVTIEVTETGGGSGGEGAQGCGGGSGPSTLGLFAALALFSRRRRRLRAVPAFASASPASPSSLQACQWRYEALAV